MRLLEGIGFSAEDLDRRQAEGIALGAAQLGTLDPSAPADLLVFREDPTQDLKALGSLEAVVADGRLYTVEELHAALAAQDHYFQRWFYDRTTVWLARKLARIGGHLAP